jgi:hypothetical protein
VFESNFHPIVGQQVTLNGTNAPRRHRIDLLLRARRRGRMSGDRVHEAG